MELSPVGRELDVLYIEDRPDHIVQAEFLLSRVKGYTIHFASARTMIEGEHKARILLEPRRGTPHPVVILCDLHVPTGTMDVFEGTHLLALLANAIRRGELAQALLVGITSDLTDSRRHIGRYATEELWLKPLSLPLIRRMLDLVAEGGPWVHALDTLSRPYADPSVIDLVQALKEVTKRWWLHTYPVEAIAMGKAVVGMVSPTTLVLTPEQHRLGLSVIQRYGSVAELRVHVRHHHLNATLSRPTRILLGVIIDGGSQKDAETALRTTRFKLQPHLHDLYLHLSRLVL